ncbi:MAG TPA: aldo/keto reductase [Candidatus Polarisedimenticolaceae bacterium]|nr:aldo/keto reductase [Candidatus Polarisedimenticolaceae bacterium]
MKHRPLGATGLTVSEIGFGAWGLGATMWRGVPDEEGAAALEAAIDHGVDFVDTALAYGDGHSERLIARTIAGRSGLTVATKIPPKNGEWPARASSKIADVFPADYVRRSCETSLRNLGREALDVQQFHVWHDAWLEEPAWPETRRAMEELVREGKVRQWGISINDHAPETALRALRDPIFATAQVIYNIFDRSPERALFSLARERDLGIVVRVPFDEGALTGSIRADTVFPAGDWRHRYFRDDRRRQAADRVDALKPLLGDEARSLPELALRFILSRPEVSTVIPGMRRTANARANAAVSDGRVLSAELLRKLEGHAWDKNWYGD